MKKVVSAFQWNFSLKNSSCARKLGLMTQNKLFAYYIIINLFLFFSDKELSRFPKWTKKKRKGKNWKKHWIMFFKIRICIEFLTSSVALISCELKLWPSRPEQAEISLTFIEKPKKKLSVLKFRIQRGKHLVIIIVDKIKCEYCGKCLSERRLLKYITV